MRDRKVALDLLVNRLHGSIGLSAVFHPMNYPELTREDLVNHPELALVCDLQCRSESVYRLSSQDRLYGPRSEATLDFTVRKSTVGLAMRDGSKREVSCITIGAYSIHKSYGRSYSITHTKTGLSLFGTLHDLKQTQCKELLKITLIACNKRGVDPINFRTHDDQVFIRNLMRSTAEELKQKK